MYPEIAPFPPLEAGCVQVWKIFLPAWKTLAQAFRPLLSADEITRLDRLKVEDKKGQFLISRGMTRSILSAYLDLHPRSLEIKCSPAGKPYLEKTNISFNVSHSRDYLLIGVSTLPGIGLDIQEMYPITGLETIIPRYFNPAEQEYLAELPAALDGFFTLWTAKEAYLKAVGEGFTGDPKRVSIIPDGESGRFDIQDHTGKDPAISIRKLEASKGYKAAAAAEGKIEEVILRALEPGWAEAVSTPT